MKLVHNHGTEEGLGLSCPERHVDGILRGACMIAPALSPAELATVTRFGIHDDDFHADQLTRRNQGANP